MPEKSKFTVNSEQVKKCMEWMPDFIKATNVKNVDVSFTTEILGDKIYFRFEHITFEY